MCHLTDNTLIHKKVMYGFTIHNSMCITRFRNNHFLECANELLSHSRKVVMNVVVIQNLRPLTMYLHNNLRKNFLYIYIYFKKEKERKKK